MTQWERWRSKGIVNRVRWIPIPSGSILVIDNRLVRSCPLCITVKKIAQIDAILQQRISCISIKSLATVKFAYSNAPALSIHTPRIQVIKNHSNRFFVGLTSEDIVHNFNSAYLATRRPSSELDDAQPRYQSEPRPWDTDPTPLQLALARGHCWLTMLETGQVKS